MKKFSAASKYVSHKFNIETLEINIVSLRDQLFAVLLMLRNLFQSVRLSQKGNIIR